MYFLFSYFIFIKVEPYTEDSQIENEHIDSWASKLWRKVLLFNGKEFNQASSTRRYFISPYRLNQGVNVKC